MTQKDITFSTGEKFSLAFNLKTQIAFEKITEKAFDLSLLTHAEYRVALYYAAITTANPDADITLDKLMEADFNDIKLLNDTVEGLISDYYHIPAIAEQHVPVADDTAEGDKPKN